MLKKLLVLILMVGVLFTGCSVAKEDKAVNEQKSDSTNSVTKKTITLWGFSQTDLEPIKNAYEKENVNINLVIKPPADYPNLLKQSLASASGPDVPDAYILDIVYVKQFTDSDFSEDLSSLENDAIKAGMYKYILDIGRDSEGKLKALSWQATPGGFYYRRSLAKQYLGTDDPEKVYEAIKDVETFRKTAADINKKSGGTVSIISSINELQFAFLYSRSSSWIKDGKLNIDENVYKLLDIAKEFYENKYVARVPKLYDKEWYSTMRDNYQLDGKIQYVMGYLLPPWALHNHFVPNAKPANGEGKDTTGDWAITKAPLKYIRGGSWIAVNPNSKVKTEAIEFVKTITTNIEFMEKLCRQKGDFSSSSIVNEKLGQDYSSDFLGGQNHFEVFNKIAQEIDASNLVSPYDQVLNALFADQLNQYAMGMKSKEQAIADFKEAIKSQFGDVIKVD